MLLAAALAATGAAAEVVERSDDGFVSAFTVSIAAEPERVWQALTRELAAWWDPAHSYSGDAGNLALVLPGDAGDAAPGLVERSDAMFVRHMALDVAWPPRTLRLRGGLGPLQAMAASGSMSFELEAKDRATALAYRYTVNGAGTGALADAVDRVQLSQVRRLARYVETGSPDGAADPVP